MDGRFVPNITIGPMVVAAIRRVTRLPLDVHLMIVEPERYIDEFARAGADLISVHVETAPHLHRLVEQIRHAGKKAAVAVNPHSPLDGLDVVLPELEMVLLMSVNPGFGGQKFIEAVVPKVSALRSEIRAAPPGRRHRGRRRHRLRHGAGGGGCRGHGPGRRLGGVPRPGRGLPGRHRRAAGSEPPRLTLRPRPVDIVNGGR